MDDSWEDVLCEYLKKNVNLNFCNFHKAQSNQKLDENS